MNIEALVVSVWRREPHSSPPAHGYKIKCWVWSPITADMEEWMVTASWNRGSQLLWASITLDDLGVAHPLTEGECSEVESKLIQRLAELARGE